jgi:hypothetical protein
MRLPTRVADGWPVVRWVTRRSFRFCSGWPDLEKAGLAVHVERRVSSRGGIQVIGQRIHVGMGHAGRTVTLEVDEHHLRILDHNHELVTVVA